MPTQQYNIGRTDEAAHDHSIRYVPDAFVLVFLREVAPRGIHMAIDSALILIAAATAANGVLAGASLDQSIKQLPARRSLGNRAFSAYSRAADLGPGVVWYATLGIGGALLTCAAAVVEVARGTPATQATPIYAAAALSILHSLTTARAAPTNFSQKRVGDDEEQLAAIFDRFERWQTARSILQALTFAASIVALITYAPQ
jgi:hypothetical protein